MLNPITYTEGVVSDFLRYQLSTYAFADQNLYRQMRDLLNLEQTRDTPLLRGPYISLSRTFLAGATLERMIGEGLLHPHIKQLSPYPAAYAHQEQAVRAIAAGKTTLIATGTGSGKTESFLWPIISRCLQLRDEDAAPGIVAVIVYPMNALAEDQLQRMRQLLVGTGISFGMYVGKTPQKESDVNGQRLPPGGTRADYDNRLQAMRRQKADVPLHPAEERASREAMRTPGQQPRILLTNVKQLELLLTRQQDLELFDNASLEYLVFDEAHTFTGANGAETACLIRRLRAYCGKDAQSTTCIAASATIADPVQGAEAGRAFASRFFGVDSAQVELIGETYEEDVWGEPRTVSAPFTNNPTEQLQTALSLLGPLDKPAPSPKDIEAFCAWLQKISGQQAPAASEQQAPAAGGQQAPAASEQQAPAASGQQTLAASAQQAPDASGSPAPGDDWRQALHHWLSHNELVYQVAQALQQPQPLSELLEALGKTLGRKITEAEILIWLALGAAARSGERPLLRPVVHGFLRGIGGAVVTFPDPEQKATQQLTTPPSACGLPESRECANATSVGAWGGNATAPALHLSAEAATRDNADLKPFPLSACNTCGQHYFEHRLQDFEFLGDTPGGGSAEGQNRVWRAMDAHQGGVRAISLDHQVGREEDAPLRTAPLLVCRYCGTAHADAAEECVGCGRSKPFKPLHFVQQKEKHPGHLTRCVSCGTNGVRLSGFYREPARPVRASHVADIHVLAQSMIHRAERRRLLVFADNRQDAAFQAGWMQDHSRRYRLRELMYQKLKGERQLSVSDLTRWLDDQLDKDDELSRSLIPEVWQVEPRSDTGRAHDEERKWFLRVQVVREITQGARQTTGLEPLGRLKVRYLGLSPDLPVIAKWAPRLGCDAERLRDGLASLLDAARSLRLAHDPVTKAWSKYWGDGDKEVLRGYLPNMQGVPQALVFTRDGEHDKNRIVQWFSPHSTVARQAALAWGAAPEEVQDFLAEVWDCCTQLGLLTPVQLKGSRGGNLPGCHNGAQVNVDRLLLAPGKGMHRCQTCRRLHSRPTPADACMAWRCKGRLAFEQENRDNYDLLTLNEGFAMLRAKEHSAQIPGPQREKTEIAFKGGGERINTLVCTPTLELGVDIGTLDSVLMRNVPPKPANYWQRAGRAGRQFRMALNLTYARPASHDRAYFAEPEKMLAGLVEPPSFNLRNPVMVAKHVHATLVTSLFKLLRDGQLPEAAHQRLDAALQECLPSQIKPYLFNADDSVRTAEPLQVDALREQLAQHRTALLQAVQAAFSQGWPPGDQAVVEQGQLEAVIDNCAAELQKVINRLFQRLQWALGQTTRLQEVARAKGALDPDEEALRGRCERLVKKLKGAARRSRAQAEGVDETGTYSVLAAEGFLPGYGLDTGAVTLTHVVPKFIPDLGDWEIRRNTALAIREQVPGNLIYANSHKFIPRHFHRLPEEPLAFAVDIAAEAVQETGGANATAVSMGATQVQGIQICDVDAQHDSYISDDEDRRFQLPVAVFAQDKGRHSGGADYEWGHGKLQLRHGMHMRLVNVGAARQVREGGALGYPLCLICGASRSPLSPASVLSKFTELHSDHCGQPPASVCFYADTVADALVLPDCASRELAYSLTEALRQGAASVLDMEVSDLQVQLIGKSGAQEIDALLFDPMPGGSGLLEQMLEHWPQVIAAALRLVEGCPGACETSCIDCLQHFRNSFYHDQLNRHTAGKWLRDWGDAAQRTHEAPPVQPNETLVQEPVNQPEQQLHELLNRAGLGGFVTDRGIRLSGKATARPDAFFDKPNPHTEGVCVYLDGMSGHLHGNPETAAQDRAMRDELRNTFYEVIEIQFPELSDRTAMRKYIARIARAVLGTGRARELREDDSWFDAASADAPTPPAGTPPAEAPPAADSGAPPDADILPFTRIAPEDDAFRPYGNCVPLTSLKAAAGAWSAEQAGMESLADQAEEWALLEGVRLQPGMFVAQVTGHSMEPEIPAGSHCLFRPVPGGTRQGRKLLVRHAGVTDAETGGEYTVKVYASQITHNEDGSWRHERVTLSPLNPAYAPIVLEPDAEGQVAPIAEFLRVLRRDD